MTILGSLSFIECGTHMDKPWFNWEGGIVPYYYNASVTKDDRNMMRQIMKEIEKKTCIRFKEQVNPPSGLTRFVIFPSFFTLSKPQVTMLKSEFKVGAPVFNGGGPGSVRLSTQRQSLLLRIRNSSSKVPTGWRTRDHAGLRTRVGFCMSCSICLASCTPR